MDTPPASKRHTLTLGIETSCDETALALLASREADGRVECCAYSSLVHSQAELHSAYGGVYPTLAKREHGKNIVALLHALITEAEELLGFEPVSQERFIRTLDMFRAEIAPQNPELFEAFAAAEFLRRAPKIDRIAVTEGPGLEPALWVGINLARMLSELWNIPVAAIDHMEGHIVGSFLPPEIANGAWHTVAEPPFPAVALLISGGHTELVSVGSVGRYEVIGETVDDAVGEAFDKTARLLGLPYPGGPYLSELAGKARMEGIASPVKLPRPMISSKDLNFSFSGLKTAVLYATRTAPKDANENIDEAWKKGLSREFEDAVTETLDAKLRAAIGAVEARSIILGGGVSANHVLRAAFASTAEEHGIPIFMPSRLVSGDNALMIALAGALDAKNAHSTKELKANGTKRL